MPFVPLAPIRAARRPGRQIPAGENRGDLPAARTGARRKLLHFAIAGIALAAGLFLAVSPVFRVQNIRVAAPDGDFPAADAELILGDFLGRHFLGVDARDAEVLLRKNFPNLRRVRLDFVWPEALRAELEAWPAVARIPRPDGEILISERGLRIFHPGATDENPASGSGESLAEKPVAMPLLEISPGENFALPEDPAAEIFDPATLRAWGKFRDDAGFRAGIAIRRVEPRGLVTKFLTAENQEILVRSDADPGTAIEKIAAVTRARDGKKWTRIDLRIPTRAFVE